MTQPAVDPSNPHGYGGDVGPERPQEEMVLYEKQGHIAIVSLNRPERHNALLVPWMGDELQNKMRMAQDDDEVKVVIIRGNGPSFCAGMDLRRPPVESFGLKKGKRLPQSLRIRGVSRHPGGMGGILMSNKTTIAAVHGGALAGGFHIVLNCDLVVAADNAFFGEPESRIGFAGFETSMPLAMLRLGINRAYEALITGRRMSAQELKDWGVVASVVPEEKLMDEAMRYAKAVAAHSTDGLMIGRQAMKMFWSLMGHHQWEMFFQLAHPLFTNIVWREDEFNFIRERNRLGLREANSQLAKIWEDLGFE